MSRRKIRSDSESDSEEANYIASSFKRTKITNDHEEENPTSEELEEEEVMAPTQVLEENSEPLLVGEDGFVEGSIVKMVLVNFVTYDYCEIYPGPQMNMIIGPNGTGKSTIVCAIALGLGGTPALLGRAKNIAEFVKTGEDEASILIELKHVDKRNVVIQRFLKKSNNSTSWKINGKPSSQKDVMSIVYGFNIQVDNLCQFLPQDRVAEFAELSPSQLLERTQSAAGRSDLHEMQKNLISWRNQQKTLAATNDSDLDQLKNLNAKNAQLEKDVIRMEQKKKIEDGIRLLNAQIPLVKYTESKTRTDEYKRCYEIEKEKVMKAKEELAPISNVTRIIEKEKIEASKSKINAERHHSDAMDSVKKVANKISEVRGKIEQTNKEISAYESKLPQIRKDIEIKEKNISVLEKETQNPPEADASEIESQVEEVNRQIREISEKSSEVKDLLSETNKKKDELRRAAEFKNREILELQNVLKVRHNKLNQDSEDTIKAYTWLKQNERKFNGKVYEPVVMLLNLKDSRYAAIVESALGGSKSKLLKTFIFENKEDYMKFTAYTVDEMKWKISAQWPGELSSSITRTPITTEELRSKYRMEYFVSDLIEAPEYVLKTLCLEKNINMFPVALQRSREQEIVDSGVFGKFAIGQALYTVKTSQYGNRSKQTTTTSIRPAHFLGDSIDVVAQANLEREVREIKIKIQHHDVDIEEKHKEINTYKGQVDELRHKKEDLVSQKRDIQIKFQDYNRKKRLLDKLRPELIDLKNQPKKNYEKIDSLKKSIVSIMNEEEKYLEDYVEALDKVTRTHEARLIASIQYHYLEEKYNAMRKYARDHSQKLIEAEQNSEIAKKEYKIAERDTKMYMEKCKIAGSELPESLGDAFKEIIQQWKDGKLNINSDDLDMKITEERAKADSLTFSNSNAMKHYEERKAEIARLELKVSANKAKLEELSNNITQLKTQWEPLVKQLVEKINTKFKLAFQRIHCVGEIKVDEHEDFDKWGINIYVKFRDNEKLQLLTGQRQSGGERSVTTILYLMSLQDLAKSPFRVVDEINQGMDPRNERMIHEQIVQGASRPGTSQYFLITPKLLPDLYYNERIRVLCIYNSEWLPEKIKPLSEYLENYRRTKVN